MRLISPRGVTATTLAVGAVAAAGAHASEPPGTPPILPPIPPAERPAVEAAQWQKAGAFYYDVPQTARYSNAEMNAFAHAVKPAAESKPVGGLTQRSDAPSGGLDYGDAAVGAGITGGIALLIVAGNLTMRRRRQPRYP
jgi:hypothetical protein